MPSYEIQIKSNFKINENGFESFAFQLFGTLSSTNEILFDKTDAFTHADDLLTFKTSTTQDLGDILQVKVRNIHSGVGFGELELEYIQVDEDRFPLNTTLATRHGGQKNFRFLVFATKTEISSTLIYLPEIKDIYYLKINTGLVEFSGAMDRKISVKLWGENGNTILPEDDENFNKEEEKGWIVLESAVFSSNALTNAFVVGNYGKISCCAVKFEPSLIGVWKTIPAEIGLGFGSFSFPETLHIKNIEIIRESFTINFPVDKTLSETLGNRLYLNTSGPLERLSEPMPEEIKRDTSTISVFKWITRNQNEYTLLNRFLTEQKIVATSWGKAFISSETDSSELTKSLDNIEINLDENERQLWENLKPRLDQIVSKRSFALDFLDQRLKEHLDELTLRVQTELDVIIAFFGFGKLDISDPVPPPPPGEKGNPLLKCLGILGTIATVASKVPVPQVATAAKGIGAALGFIGMLVKEEPKEDTFRQDLFEAEKKNIEIHKAIQDGKNRMILVTTDLTINVYQVFQKLELGRKIAKFKALRSMGLIEEFSLLESLLKDNEIQGVPDSVAPANAHIKPLLRMIYDRFLVEKCHIKAKEVPMEISGDESLHHFDLIDLIKDPTDEDFLFISWTYLRFKEQGLWAQQNWQIFQDPIINPTSLSSKLYKRILWIYGKDLISLLKLLKDKARIVPVLCEIRQEYERSRDRVFVIENHNFSYIEKNRPFLYRAYMMEHLHLDLKVSVKRIPHPDNGPLREIADNLLSLVEDELPVKGIGRPLFALKKKRTSVLQSLRPFSRDTFRIAWLSSDLPRFWVGVGITADFPSTEEEPINMERSSLFPLDNGFVAFLHE